MRGASRNAAFVSLFALALIALSAMPTQAQLQLPTQDRLDLYNRTYAAAYAAPGFRDSLTISINGAIGTTGTLDTLVAFETGKFYFTDSPTLHGCARLSIFGGTNTSCDTIFATIRTSTDGTNWGTNTTFVGLVGTSGDEYISAPITCDTDLGGTTGVGTAWLQRWWQVIIRADGNTAAVWTGAKVRLDFRKVQ